MRIEDMKPRKKSLLSMLGSGVKTVKHKAKSLIMWKPKSNPFNDPEFYDKKWNKKERGERQRKTDNLSNFKLKNDSKASDWIKAKNIFTGVRSDEAMIKRKTGRRALGPYFYDKKSSTGWYTLKSNK